MISAMIPISIAVRKGLTDPELGGCGICRGDVTALEVEE
jgi:hypothetical protein